MMLREATPIPSSAFRLLCTSDGGTNGFNGGPISGIIKHY